jgi:hypothetical protein
MVMDSEVSKSRRHNNNYMIGNRNRNANKVLHKLIREFSFVNNHPVQSAAACHHSDIGVAS